jgi:hypothetical protein
MKFNFQFVAMVSKHYSILVGPIVMRCVHVMSQPPIKSFWY